MKKYILMAILTLAFGASLHAWHRGGWGWGPSFGLNFNVPADDTQTYVVPAANDSYYSYKSNLYKPAPFRSARPTYQTYRVVRKPKPSVSFSVGTGGYWGSPYWGPSYWGRPGVSFGVGF